MADKTISDGHFSDRLCDAICRKGTPLMVGLDPRSSQLPKSLIPGEQDPQSVARAFQTFCCEVIDSIADLVPIVKPNAAFFEALGPSGMQALAAVNQHANKNGLLVLMDAKRGDIGSTAAAYAEAYLAKNNAWFSDALTVNPFLGADTIEPMFDVAKQNGTGLFVLVKTSNAGSGDIQDLEVDGSTISERVAESVEAFCKESLGEFGYGICGSVVGATYPAQISRLREKMPSSIFLIPGVGAQGGSAADVANAFDDRGLGAVINSSRGIIFAHQRKEFSGHKNWQQAVELAARQLIDELATETSAGKLRTAAS